MKMIRNRLIRRLNWDENYATVNFHISGDILSEKLDFRITLPGLQWAALVADKHSGP